jgi:hypothetical protein
LCKASASKTGTSAQAQLFMDSTGLFVRRGSAIFDVYAAHRIAQPVVVGNN